MFQSNLQASWIRPPIMPEACRIIEKNALFDILSKQIARTFELDDLRHSRIIGLRATKVPMWDDLFWLEAQLETANGPAVADYFWDGLQLEPINDTIAHLSVRMRLKYAMSGAGSAAQQVDLARMFCVLLPTEDWLFWPCSDLDGMAQIYGRALFGLPNLADRDFAPKFHANTGQAFFSIILAYGDNLFSAKLQTLPDGKFAMISDTHLCELPPPRLRRGSNGWIYLEAGREHD